jgi:hypothetical protein
MLGRPHHLKRMQLSQNNVEDGERGMGVTPGAPAEASDHAGSNSLTAGGGQRNERVSTNVCAYVCQRPGTFSSSRDKFGLSCLLSTHASDNLGHTSRLRHKQRLTKSLTSRCHACGASGKRCNLTRNTRGGDQFAPPWTSMGDQTTHSSDKLPVQALTNMKSGVNGKRHDPIADGPTSRLHIFSSLERSS